MGKRIVSRAKTSTEKSPSQPVGNGHAAQCRWIFIQRAHFQGSNSPPQRAACTKRADAAGAVWAATATEADSGDDDATAAMTMRQTCEQVRVAHELFASS